MKFRDILPSRFMVDVVFAMKVGVKEESRKANLYLSKRKR